VATTYEQERKLQGDIAPLLEHDLPGVEVLAVELASPDRFVVYVDHPEGVDHALCVRVTDVLRDYLREYSVDVSSPGTDRPLRTPSHFASVVGRHVKLRTTEAKKVNGEVVAADATHVTIGENAIPYEHIVRANLIDER
jgi:ribosome maturation factor RimP